MLIRQFTATVTSGLGGRAIRQLLLVLMMTISVAGIRADTMTRTDDRDEALAAVNGDTIRVSQLERELMRIHGMQTQESQRGDFSVERLIQRLINDRLIIQEARAIELDHDEDLREAVARYQENLAFRAFQLETFPDTFTATEPDIRRTFERDFQLFRIRMLCTTDSALTASLADSIRRGASMEELARKYSVDKFRDAGGDAGVFTLIALPLDIRDELQASKPGDLIGPAFIWRVHALLRVEGRMPADSARLDSLRPMIAEQVSKELREQARRDFANRMQVQYRVVIDSALLDSLLPRLISGAPGSDRPILTINGRSRLTETELRNKYTHRIAGRRDREPVGVLRQVLNEQIEAALIKEVASDSAFLMQERFVAPARAFEDSILLEQYLAEVVAPRITVTETDIAEHYERHRESFRAGGEYRVATLSRDSLGEAQEDFRLLQSGTDFSWLVRRHSTDEAKNNGGVRDWLNATAFSPEILRDLDSIAVGGFTLPHKTQLGYTIFKVLDKKPGGIQPLGDVRERIRVSLIAQRQMEAIDRVINELRAHAEIWLNDNLIRELRVEGALDAPPSASKPEAEKP